MKIYTLFLGLALALTACGTADNHDAHDHEHEGHDHEAEGHEGHNDEEGAESDEIVVKPEDAKKFGIETKVIEPTSFSDVITVSGRFEAPATDQATVTAKGSGILRLKGGIGDGSKVGAGATLGTISTQGVQGGSEIAAIRAETEAARREMERLKPLADEGIVTQKEYNAAVAAYRTASARTGNISVSPSVTSPISGTITQILAQDGQYVEVGAPIAVVTKETNQMTLRADVPERYSKEIHSIRTANFKPAYSEEVMSLGEMGGKLLSASRNAGTSTRGYVPVYFTFNARNTPIVAGGFAEVYLIGDEKPESIIVPVSSLTEAQGVKYVYVQIDEEGYEKRPVEVGGNDGANVEILSGVKPGDKVVVKGTTFVKLAETKAVPEGHSHNH